MLFMKDLHALFEIITSIFPPYYQRKHTLFNALSRINHYMKQNQKEIFLPSFIISYVSYCPLIWMFCTKKSTKKINAVHERSSRIIRNDYQYLSPLLLEETHQITLHQRYTNALMIEVYMYLKEHSPDTMNDIFKLRENTSNL